MVTHKDPGQEEDPGGTRWGSSSADPREGFLHADVGARQGGLGQTLECRAGEPLGVDIPSQLLLASIRSPFSS